MFSSLFLRGNIGKLRIVFKHNYTGNACFFCTNPENVQSAVTTYEIEESKCSSSTQVSSAESYLHGLINTLRNATKEDSKNLTAGKHGHGSGESALLGFQKTLEKAKTSLTQKGEYDENRHPEKRWQSEHDTFPAMIRHSKLMQLGDISSNVVTGKVFEVVGDDLYIDFGGKFHCVCPRPKANSEHYIRNAKVKLRLNDLEMSSSFLGSDVHVSLLEADATLIGLLRKPGASSQTN